jgi:threonine dehydratase
MIALSEIVQAKRVLSKVVNKTPFVYAPNLSQQNRANIYLKKENLQITGAYKLRGAYNKISSLSEEERKRGVIAASAGNHAQGVAYSAKAFGIPSTIVMPNATPLLKVTNTKALGSEVVLYGDNYDEAYKYAHQLAKSKGLTFIHPFEDDKVIAGQGTIALEMIDEISELNVVIVPIGGGGLISGIASALKQLDPTIKVIGVTASGAPALKNSYKSKKIQNSTSVRTIADGIAVRDVSEKNLKTIIECVDDIVEVDDEEIANAILFLLEQQKLVVEGGGAVGVAALMHEKIKLKKDQNVGVVITGGNIDVQMLSVIIEKGLIKSYRKMNLVVTLIDKPGALRELTDILADSGANITQIGYDRVSTTLSYGDANVTLALETKGKEHQDEIRKKLDKSGYRYTLNL